MRDAEDLRTRCEYCGAEYEVGPPATVEAATAVTPRAAPDTEPGSETHCEWCGAEYAVPGDRG